MDIIKNLTSYEVERALETLPEAVVEMLKVFEKEICVAGGFLRDLVVKIRSKDVDIFGTDAAVILAAADWFEIHAGLYTDRKETANAISFYKKHVDLDLPVVQFVTRAHYNSHLDLINSFDFTICQAALWYDDLDKKFFSVVTETFHTDSLAGKLNYTAPVRDEDPGASILRMTRFLGRGYTITQNSLAAVLARFVISIPFGCITEEETKEKIKEEFRSVGYAGKQVIKTDDYLPF